jgi:hypothetical protein
MTPSATVPVRPDAHTLRGEVPVRRGVTYAPSLCRRIDPETGKVVAVIDPVTREERRAS